MRKNNKLTDNDLHNIISESVKTVINENRTVDTLTQVHEMLMDIANSGFIPFSSPSPSSTELKIKNSVLAAIDNIESAISGCNLCGYGECGNMTNEGINESLLNYYLAGMDTLRFAGPSSREGRHDRTRLGGRIANLYDYFKWKKKRYDLSDEWQKKEREEERMARKKR